MNLVDRLSASQRHRLATASRGQLVQLAREWNLNPDSLRGALSRHRNQEASIQRASAAYEATHRQQNGLVADIPEGIAEHSEQPLRIPTGNLLVLGDLHCPHHSALMLKRAVATCRKHFPHVKDVAFIGDTFNFSQISSHPKTGPSASFLDEKLMVARVLRAVLKSFEHGWIINGNHDERQAKRLDMALDLEGLIYDCFRGDLPVAQLHISNLDWMLVDGDRPWKLAHPSNHSAIGAKVACEIAQLDQINVILGHNHRVGRAMSADGRWEGIDNGHCTYPDFHFYVKRRANKYARWSAGFTILSDGFAHTFTDVGTDWAALDVDSGGSIADMTQRRAA